MVGPSPSTHIVGHTHVGTFFIFSRGACWEKKRNVHFQALRRHFQYGSLKVFSFVLSFATCVPSAATPARALQQEPRHNLVQSYQSYKNQVDPLEHMGHNQRPQRPAIHAVKTDAPWAEM